MTTVAAAVCSPPDPSEALVAFRIFLICTMRRMIIMCVRRMLSERQIERYEVSRLTEVMVENLVPES